MNLYRLPCLTVSLLLFTHLAFAGRGGNVKINNQTPYLFTRVHVERDNNVTEFASPETVMPGNINTIYAEFSYERFISVVSVIYSVTCPDNQLDQFRIKIIREDRYSGVGSIYVSAVGHDTHCISLFGNEDLSWTWNGYGITPVTINITPYE